MSVSMLVIRPGVFDVLETRCTFLSMRAGLNRVIFRMRLTRQQDRYEFALESGHDEQTTANSHNIFKCGDHQVGNFEGLH
jgi:hypothetical protein